MPYDEDAPITATINRCLPPGDRVLAERLLEAIETGAAETANVVGLRRAVVAAGGDGRGGRVTDCRVRRLLRGLRAMELLHVDGRVYSSRGLAAAREAQR